VGSSLMAEDDLDLACRTLTLGHNKVCGMTRSEDLQAIAEAGAIYAGLIFAKKSPRYVTPEKALALTTAQRASTKSLNFVGVFVNEAPQVISDIASLLDLFAVQLHGNESEYEISQVREALKAAGSQAKIWKAVAVNVDAADTELTLVTNADRILFDSKAQQAAGVQFGGTGQVFNWQLSLPNKAESMLAGGLTAKNAAEASKQGFFGLDFNSGLECQPGVKDHQQIAAAFSALRTY